MATTYTINAPELPEVVYYCRRCEQFSPAPSCPCCGQPGARIKRNTANATLWGENLARLSAWAEAGRIIPALGDQGAARPGKQ